MAMPGRGHEPALLSEAGRFGLFLTGYFSLPESVTISPPGSSFFLRDDNEFLRKRCNFKKINKRGRLAGYFPAGGLPFPFPGIPDREKDPQK